MGSGGGAASSPTQAIDVSIAGLRERHQKDLKNLTLLTQPFKTFKFFLLAVGQYVGHSRSYLLGKGGWLLLLNAAVAAIGILLFTVDGRHEQHFQEILKYVEFGLWWVILGVASSIGLGSGLHTFVLYLGPHIAFFTIRAVQCGRVDIKTAPYDTIQLNKVPSWLDKDCSEFGPPLFTSVHGSRVPLSSILPKVQLEAVLWGVGTAIGELPPYFISRAAQISDGRVDSMEELDASTNENRGFISTFLIKIKRWFFSRSQHLNFFTILVLASVPNPLFDLAGIMCGQFGIPFWKFFLATLVGKAIIKAHLQAVFIISVCNNQLLDWTETVPGFSSALPNIVSKLNAVKDKYMTASHSAAPYAKAKEWDLSFASIWSTVVWLMIINFAAKIVTETARKYMKKLQEKELNELTDELGASRDASESNNTAS